MAIQSLFPSFIYKDQLLQSESETMHLNQKLIDDCIKISEIDEDGLDWSEENYYGGYTSYPSYNQLHQFSTNFENLKFEIDKHLNKFVEALAYDIESSELEMTDCWLNIMPQGTQHSGHIHPHSVISGTYYLQVPEDSSAIKFEDPRLAMHMNCPKRKTDAGLEHQSFVSLPAIEGDIVLFESYLRHEVPANLSEEDRISISFNYQW